MEDKENKEFKDFCNSNEFQEAIKEMQSTKKKYITRLIIAMVSTVFSIWLLFHLMFIYDLTKDPNFNPILSILITLGIPVSFISFTLCLGYSIVFPRKKYEIEYSKLIPTLILNQLFTDSEYSWTKGMSRSSYDTIGFDYSYNIFESIKLARVNAGDVPATFGRVILKEETEEESEDRNGNRVTKRNVEIKMDAFVMDAAVTTNDVHTTILIGHEDSLLGYLVEKTTDNFLPQLFNKVKYQFTSEKLNKVFNAYVLPSEKYKNKDDCVQKATEILTSVKEALLLELYEYFGKYDMIISPHHIGIQFLKHPDFFKSTLLSGKDISYKYLKFCFERFCVLHILIQHFNFMKQKELFERAEDAKDIEREVLDFNIVHLNKFNIGKDMKDDSNVQAVRSDQITQQ